MAAGSGATRARQTPETSDAGRQGLCASGTDRAANHDRLSRVGPLDAVLQQISLSQQNLAPAFNPLPMLAREKPKPRLAEACQMQSKVFEVEKIYSVDYRRPVQHLRENNPTGVHPKRRTASNALVRMDHGIVFFLRRRQG